MSDKRPDRFITQIIPATGFLAVYKQDDGSEIFARLACWALVEEGGEQSIIGMDGEGDYPDYAEGTSNFDRYIHESNLPAGEAREKERAG